MLDSARILAQARERARRQNGGAVGRSREELITPALVLGIDAAQRNLDRMASTVNCYDVYHVVRGGTVIDVWPIIPRGPGHHGLAGLPWERF